MELWLPATGWNGKYQAVGNGAFNGNINHGQMAPALARGYAVSSTDTGHTGNNASFALGHPEKLVDFGWRAMHETAVASKKMIAAYYGNDPKFSYFNGCSAGGRQAMKAAQRSPADFHGIIAGAPGLDWTGRAARAVQIAKHLEQNTAGQLGDAERQLLHTAAVESCDLIDGVKDGVIENPKRCKFDPGVLVCKGAGEERCLTAAQIETARMIYAPATNPRTKRAINGLEPGSELSWTDLGWTASARTTGLEQFRFLVFGDPAWTIQKFNFDSDIVLAEERDNNTVNALDPNLKPFISGGGKLIQYHGSIDAQIAPAGTTQYSTPWQRRSAAKTGSAVPIACSWRPAWATAAAARGRTPRHAHSSRAMGRRRHCAQSDRRDDYAAHGESGQVASALSLSASCCLQRHRSTDDARNFACRIATSP